MNKLLLLPLMLFGSTLNGQWFGQLKIGTDAYSIGDLDRSKITQIYVDESGLNENLALLPYIQKIRLRLFDLGYSIAKTVTSSKFILRFDVFTTEPIIRTRESSYTLRGETQTVERKTKDGKKETITIQGEDRSIPVLEEDIYFQKIMRMKLYLKESNRLIWQAESIIDNKVDSHGNYAHLLVYEPLRYFLKTTPAHPTENVYGRRHRRIIADLFAVPKY